MTSDEAGNAYIERCATGVVLLFFDEIITFFFLLTLASTSRNQFRNTCIQ